MRWWGGVGAWRPGSYLFEPSEDLDLGAGTEECGQERTTDPKPELGELRSAGPLSDLGDVYSPPPHHVETDI